MAKISVLGAGSWGTALSILLSNNGHCSFGLGLFLQIIVLRNGHSGENAEDDQDGNDFNEREALLSPVLSHRITSIHKC